MVKCGQLDAVKPVPVNVMVCDPAPCVIMLGEIGFKVGVVEAARVAEQLAFVPPLLPLQLQLHGPVPDTVLDVPDEHKLEDGALDTVTPLELPHVPFVVVVSLVAEQLAFVPPLPPLQLQLHGPLPETVPDVPDEHKLEDGALDTVIPLELPHVPFVVVVSEVEKVAVTVTLVFIVTVQLPTPEQPPPDQPTKLECVAGVAYRLTLAPLL